MRTLLKALPVLSHLQSPHLSSAYCRANPLIVCQDRRSRLARRKSRAGTARGSRIFTPTLIVICCIALLLTGIRTDPCAAQAFQNAGSTGAQFLKIGVGARAMGMGGAFASVTGDVTTLAWNPAGIGTVNAVQLSVQHTAWVAGLNHEFVGLVVPVSDQVNLAFHTVYLTSGDIEITTIDAPQGTGEYYNTADIAAGLTGSIRLTEQLSFATTVKYVTERIKDVSSGGIAVDAGAQYATGFRSLSIGFALQNLGFEQSFSGPSLEVHNQTSTTGDPVATSELQTLAFGLPLLFRASGSFDCFEMFGERLDDHRLMLALDFNQITDTPERLALGMEYSWQHMISVRSGYLFNADELSWSVGAGLNLTPSDFVIQFDYAASSLGRFGIGHRIGLAVSFK